MFEESALALGFENGDKIISIEGNPVDNQTSYAKIALDIILNKAKYVEVDRNGEKATVYIEGKDFEAMLKGRMFDARIPFVIGGIAEGSPAAAAGLQVGDSLIAVNGESVQFFDQFVSRFKQAKNETLTLTVMRNAEGVMVPTEIEATVSAEGTLGIYPYGAGAFLSVSTKKYNLIQAVGVGITRAGQEIAGYWNQIKLLFDKDLKAYKSLGGFISIAKVFPGYWDWISFWHTTAFLSIILAVMNILPIPALDGGHVMFLLYEVVTRRKPSDKFMEYAQMFGLAVLLLLMVYANGNDIIKLFK
jgi:regulator of sigma E protease